MTNSYYKDKYGRNFTPGQGLPAISTDLDSVRVYQFEIQFFGLPEDITNVPDLTLAAKKVTGIEMRNEPIPVDRVNDKVFYPGKTTPGELMVDFDNLYLRETSSDLFRWFKSTYNPLTGEVTQNAQPGGGAGRTFKADRVKIVMLDNTLVPHSEVELYGVYPTAWKAAELNYAQNQMHQISVNFKYDFMDTYNRSNPNG